MHQVSPSNHSVLGGYLTSFLEEFALSFLPTTILYLNDHSEPGVEENQIIQFGNPAYLPGHSFFCTVLFGRQQTC